MSQWKFQLLPNEKDVVAQGFRMDAVGQSVENEVNDALRYPFKFHKVNKIVVCLGPTENPQKDYVEILGVGQKQWPCFSLEDYIELDDLEKVVVLRSVVLETFNWIEANFEDAQFVDTARKNLKWAT